MTDDQHNYRQMPLAIIGISCIFPKAGDLSAYWNNIREGVDAITDVPPTHWRPEDYFTADRTAPDMTYARRGGFIDPVPFDPLYYGISPNNIEATDTTQLLGMVAARAALLDAGYATGRDNRDGRPFDRDRASVILGVTGTLELVIPLGARLGHPLWRKALRESGVDETTAAEVIKRIAEGYVPWQENSFPGLLGNVAAGRIANRFDLGGTNCVVDAACASSLSAIHMAAMELQAGRCDMAISGGIDAFNDIFMYMCFSKTPALSPTGNSRPFHSDGDGTILGEGIGVLVLKRLVDAERDRDRIYAVIKGIGTSSDGKGNAIYAPSTSGQMKALRDAYHTAGVAPSTIELVEAHGTGTRVGDAVEAEALSTVYREDRAQGTWCALGSVKSMIGHTKAAAGAAGLIKIVMALQHKVLPPTIKVDQPLESLQPEAAPVYVNTVKRPWPARPEHPRRAAVSAFGFGGSNFHAVLEEAVPTRYEIDWDGQVLIYACSGANYESVHERLNKLEACTGDWQRFRQAAARSLQDYDGRQEHRLVLVLDRTRADIGKLLRSSRSMLADHTQAYRSTPEGGFYGSGKTAPGGLALLFPGQGAQYPGMLRDLACQFPQLLAALETANVTLGEDTDGYRLSDRIYPIPGFDDADRTAQTSALTATATAQPAIGAISSGAAQILTHFGVEADGSAGHSFGELTALCYAGWFSNVDLLRLARKRGELMQQGDGDRGAMLAALAAPEDLYPLIEEQQLDLIIANHNAPAQLVLSGATNQIERAEGIFKVRRIKSMRLPVAAAFHSSFVASAERPFAEFMKSIEFTTGRIPVYSNTTAEVYGDDPALVRNLLAGQLARPVEFVREIENMYAAGIRTFVEAGPSNTLTGLVGKILADREHYAIALDASKGRRNGQYDLALLLARLAALGYNCDLRQWDAGYLASLREDKQAALTIPISGANYVQPREKSKPVTKPATAGQTQSATPPIAVAVTTAAVAVTVPTPVTSVALPAIQQGIIALQKIQEQTAQLHKQYLEGQETAQRTIQQMLQQHQQLLAGTQATPPAIPVPPGPAAIHDTAGPGMVVSGSGMAEPVMVSGEEEPHKNTDRYQNILLEVVAEKTGYPLDMLSLDMSLDTDLGIDSIKRVEILSALQEKLPGIQKIQPEDLGTFQLLQHIVEYLGDRNQSAAVNADSGAVPTSTSESDGTAQRQDSQYDLQKILLEVVALKTGYPADMLNLDMHLDTDLGIDSIKRVEILSSFQERLPQAPPVRPDELGSLQTLRQIVDYMQAGGYDKTTVTVHANAADEPTVPAATGLGMTVDGRPDLQKVLLEVVAFKTGYPVDMLNLDMQLDSDLGIDSIKRVEILSALQERMPEAPPVQPDQLGQLQTLRQIVDYMQKKISTQESMPAHIPVAVPAPDHTQQLYLGSVVLSPLPEIRPAVELPAGAQILVVDDGTDLPANVCAAFYERGYQATIVAGDAGIGPDCTALLVLVPAHIDYPFIQQALRLVQLAGKAGIKSLTSVTRLGGTFGLQDQFASDPEAAALHGIIKTAAREWPAVSCKSLDIPDQHGNRKLARAIVDEVLMSGPLEVAISDVGRFGLSLQELPWPEAPVQSQLSPEDVVIVSGGARGVTAAVAQSLAENCKVHLLLLGRSPEPEPEPEWLASLNSESEIKQAIINRQADGQRLTPKKVQDEYQRLSTNRELLVNLARLRKIGNTVRYYSVDVRDAGKVANCIEQARREIGPIRGVVHGAGVLADRYLADKTLEQFDNVYSTKVAGLRSLLLATAPDELKFLALFSSSTARYGRKGQADYAAANEVLNKMAQRYQLDHPGCRVISVNWGPWAGGMVTAPLQKVFADEGVGLIPLDAGAEYLSLAIARPGPVEVVVLGSAPAGDHNIPIAPATGTIAMQLAFERNLNTQDYPVLSAHVMNGKAVLPAALIVEWLAQGAMHHNPGMKFSGFDEFRIYKGVILENGTTVNLQIMAGPAHSSGNRDLVQVELRSGKILHARATIILSSNYDAPPLAAVALPDGRTPYQDTEFYRNGQLFHGRQLQGLSAVTACSADGISGTAMAAPVPSAWMKNPIRSTWLSDPLALDASFQLLILWCFQHSGNGSLPTAVARYRQFQRSYPGDGIRINAHVSHSSNHQAIADIDILDMHGKLVARFDGYECVIDSSLNDAFKKNQPVHEAGI